MEDREKVPLEKKIAILGNLIRLRLYKDLRLNQKSHVQSQVESGSGCSRQNRGWSNHTTKQQENSLSGLINSLRIESDT